MDTQPSAVRSPSPLARGRQLVLVDIENIVGGACTTDSAVRSAKAAPTGAALIGGTDHVVIGPATSALFRWAATGAVSVTWCHPDPMAPISPCSRS
jgi:hypothetical protein